LLLLPLFVFAAVDERRFATASRFFVSHAFIVVSVRPAGREVWVMDESVVSVPEFVWELDFDEEQLHVLW
jgi:hypothetical protein